MLLPNSPTICSTFPGLSEDEARRELAATATATTPEEHPSSQPPIFILGRGLALDSNDGGGGGGLLAGWLVCGGSSHPPHQPPPAVSSDSPLATVSALSSAASDPSQPLSSSPSSSSRAHTYPAVETVDQDCRNGCNDGNGDSAPTRGSDIEMDTGVQSFRFDGSGSTAFEKKDDNGTEPRKSRCVGKRRGMGGGHIHNLYGAYPYPNKTSKKISRGDVVAVERPLAALQASDALPWVLACPGCLRHVGSLDLQLAIVSGTWDRARASDYPTIPPSTHPSVASNAARPQHYLAGRGRRGSEKAGHSESHEGVDGVGGSEGTLGSHHCLPAIEGVSERFIGVNGCSVGGH